MKALKSIFILIITLMIIVPFTVSAGYYVQNKVNDPVEITKADVVVDGVIDESENWSAPAKLSDDYVKYFYSSVCATDIDMYFAYDENGLYFAADIDELAEVNGTETGNSVVFTTAYDENSLDENSKNVVGFNGDVFILALDPMGLYVRNGYIAATDYTIWYCMGISQNEDGSCYGRIYRSRSEGIDGEITGTNGIELGVSVAEDMMNWKVEGFLPWDLIISDMENKTFGRATCTPEELYRGGTQFRAAALYQDVIYDIEQDGAPYPYNRYMTICKEMYDASPAYRMDGEYTTLFGLNMFISENDPVFADVDKDAWYYDAVKYCYNREYMNGVSETEFKPSATLKREAFVQVLANLSGADLSGYTTSSFKDVANDAWYAPAVEWAYENGLTEGVSEGTFGAGRYVTREQLAVFMTRYAKYLTKLTRGEADLSVYKDVSEISSWAVDSVSWMVYKGFISGTGDDMIAPKATATRAQMAQIITNFMKEYGLNLY